MIRFQLLLISICRTNAHHSISELIVIVSKTRSFLRITKIVPAVFRTELPANEKVGKGKQFVFIFVEKRVNCENIVIILAKSLL